MKPDNLSDLLGTAVLSMNHLQDPYGPLRAAEAKAREDTGFLADFHRHSLASAFAERLIGAINVFDADLDQEHEVGIRLVSFGQTITFHVVDVRYHDPSLLFFLGRNDDGQRIVLVQHVSQLSFLLIALPKPDPDKPKRPFGFHRPEPAEVPDSMPS